MSEEVCDNCGHEQPIYRDSGGVRACMEHTVNPNMKEEA